MARIFVHNKQFSQEREESNPYKQLWRLQYYRYTTLLYITSLLYELLYSMFSVLLINRYICNIIKVWISLFEIKLVHALQ